MVPLVLPLATSMHFFPSGAFAWKLAEEEFIQESQCFQ